MREIRCSACAERGYPPTRLGKVGNGNATLKLWCKRCKREILVEVTDTEIRTTPL